MVFIWQKQSSKDQSILRILPTITGQCSTRRAVKSIANSSGSDMQYEVKTIANDDVNGAVSSATL